MRETPEFINHPADGRNPAPVGTVGGLSHHLSPTYSIGFLHPVFPSNPFARQIRQIPRAWPGGHWARNSGGAVKRAKRPITTEGVCAEGV